MNNEHRLQAAPALQDKDESIYQALMTAICLLYTSDAADE